MKKRSVIVKWAFSYLLILLIPFVTILINYRQSIRVIREETIAANELVLNNLKNNIDGYLEDEKSFYSNFFFSNTLNSMISNPQMDAQFYYDAQALSDEASAFSKRFPEFSYWLYLIDKDYIIGNGTANKSHAIYDSMQFSFPDMMPYGEWKELLSVLYNGDYMILKNIHYRERDECLVYANTLSGSGNRQVNVLVSVPVSVIEEMTASLSPGSALVVCIDEKPVIAMGQQGITDIPVPLDRFPSDQTVFETEAYMGIAAASKEKRIDYYMLVPQSDFWREYKNIRNVLWISLAVTLLVGIFLVRTLLRINFRPILDLLEIVGHKKGKGNEFVQIKEAYSGLKSENSTMQSKIASQKDHLLGSYLLSVMKGRITGLQKKEYETYFNLEQEGLVALAGFCIPPSDEKQLQYDELIFFMVDNIFSELMEGWKFYRIEDGRFMFYLFCFPGQEAQRWKELCMKKANRLCDMIGEKMKVSLIAAVSQTETGIGRSRFLYQEIMEAFEYKSMVGGTGVIDAGSKEKGPEEEEKDRQIIVLLEKAIEEENAQQALAVSGQMFEKMAGKPFPLLKIKVLDGFQAVVKAGSGILTDAQENQMLSYLEPLLNASDLEQMKAIFEELLCFVNEKISSRYKSENSKIVTSVKEYVEAHYEDMNLNINSIANGIQRNSQYMSKIFREETGEGILDYMNRLRISRAQELMEQGNLSLEEIGERVGYASTRTFRRAFVKVTGISPGKYRKG